MVKVQTGQDTRGENLHNEIGNNYATTNNHTNNKQEQVQRLQNVIPFNANPFHLA